MKKMLLALLIVGMLFISASAQEIWKNPNFILIYGKDLKLDNIPMLVGDSIKCYSPRGVYCGVGVLQPNLTYFNTIVLYTPVYGEDPWQNGDNGLHLGDTVKFILKYKEIVTNGYVWHETNAFSVLKDSAQTPNYIVAKEWFGGGIDTAKQIYAFKSLSCCVKRGDIDGDGNVDIADLTKLISYLNAVAPLQCFEAADVDDDGNVDIADLTKFIDFLFIRFTPFVPCNKTISWTAPQDLEQGKVSIYDIRYAHTLNDIQDWNSAIKIEKVPVPNEPGMTDYAKVPINGQYIFVGIKSADSSGNWSEISNILTVEGK